MWCIKDELIIEKEILNKRGQLRQAYKLWFKSTNSAIYSQLQYNLWYLDMQTLHTCGVIISEILSIAKAAEHESYAMHRVVEHFEGLTYSKSEFFKHKNRKSKI